MSWDKPKSDAAADARNFVQVWLAVAEDAANIAHAKRTMFLAYLAEGFTEAQALELASKL